jgi:hypothetical protein
MTTENSNLESSAIVEVNPKVEVVVENDQPEETDDVKRETKALIDAIKKRAQSEIQSAGNITREAYLNAIRQARETIEQDQLIRQDRVQEAFHTVQKEAEKNWQAIATEIEALGTRLAEAAKAAWETLKKQLHADKTQP